MRTTTRHAAKIEDAIIAEIGDSEETAVSASEIAKRLHRQKASVLDACRGLRDRGVIAQTGDGRAAKWLRNRFPSEASALGNRKDQKINGTESNTTEPKQGTWWND